ncbi:unnamed protein product [Strongylus vulgaris]|uniref:GOLD domain-containing protein n=1 Tax=Strongylus vulgaris TaxID=40348 RepID=A0A3P7IEK4_STRVU|nr:unnamed protein product [Strongylus vulgaris]
MFGWAVLVVSFVAVLAAVDVEDRAKCRDIAEARLGKRMDNYFFTYFNAKDDNGFYDNEEFQILEYDFDDPTGHMKVLLARDAAGMGALIMEYPNTNFIVMRTAQEINRGECFYANDITVWVKKDSPVKNRAEVERSLRKILVPVESRFQHFHLIFAGAGFLVGEIIFVIAITLLVREAKNNLRSSSSGTT